MLYRLIFAATILAAADGSAFARQMHVIDVWGARIEVPNEGPGGLLADAATAPGDAATGTGTPKSKASAARPLTNAAPASLTTSRP